MNSDLMSAMTGLSSGKKTHRGKRSRGKGPKAADHGEAKHPSLANEHGTAKHPALALAKALHKRQKETLTPDTKAIL
jgi:hypothetical protein